MQWSATVMAKMVSAHQNVDTASL
ncbi:hypothetical protein CGLO_13312 [Colletotrichum gloeosporioides Cg-14]|uniref:Uncharacterized protein n=1 Tax=Colletotrichum gloeosporioides (strain Cg-14) TaxID=1237896 RepID=T0LH70_COLGC|nr:hypothetical protein CGLO_13312 [Colletotrichum gloeosporioides Cg-14]